MNYLQKKGKPVLLACFAFLIGVTYYLLQTSPASLLKVDSNPEKVRTTIASSPVSESSAALELLKTTSFIKKLDKTAKINDRNYAEADVTKADINTEEDEAKEVDEKKSVEDSWKFEFDMTKDPKTGKIPRGIHFQAVEAAKKVNKFQLPAEQTNGNGLNTRVLPAITTTTRGPNNYGGRTRAVAFDKRNTQIILAGSASAGIFRSTDGGGTWTNVTPSGQIHNLMAIAQDPRVGQENTWYYGTGENSGNSASATGAGYYGFGIWKSTDNGLTWTALASTQTNLYSFDNDFDYINRIIVDPNGNVLVAASETIKRSTDGGTTWTNVLGVGVNGALTDIIYNAAGNIFYTAIHGANPNGGIYSSPDGITWTQIRTPAQLQAGGVGRITLSNVAATAKILAFYQTTTSITCTTGGLMSNAGLQLFDPAGAGTWTDHSQKISNCAGGASNPKVISFQSGYNMCITTKPDDENFVYLGGTEIYRLNLATSVYDYIGGDQGAAGATNLHVDNHLLLFEPGSNTSMWAGNDGGMRKVDVTTAIAAGPTGGYSWTDRNTNYITYQYYRADINPTTGSDFLAGAAQDNAITLQPTNATAKEIHGGDGTCIGIISGIDFNTYNVIVATQEGAISRIQDGNGINIKPTGAAQAFKTYFLLDADNTKYLYYPTNTKQLYRTRNAIAIADSTIGAAATSWEEITGVAVTLTGNVSALAVTRNTNIATPVYTASDANRKMYIGTNDGKVYRMSDPAFTGVGTTPTDITPAGSNGFVSDVAVNPYNDKEALVTYSNYNTPSVWYTADASVAAPVWVNVEGPAGSAVELASARSAIILGAAKTVVYVVGTSTGLYGTTALSGATTVWERIAGTEMGLVPVVSMRLRPTDNKMVAGTHGNGLFMLSFPQSTLPLDLLSFDATKNNANVQLKWNSANEINFSHYNVQKSDDGNNFTTFTKVSATGSGNYQTTDEKPAAGQNYYRLQMVDKDGSFRFSKIINVPFDTKVNALAVYPNPSSGNSVNLDMAFNKDIELVLEWTDVAGRSHLSSQQKAVEGKSKITVDISTLENGLYFITARNAGNNEVLQVMRFTKQ